MADIRISGILSWIFNFQLNYCWTLAEFQLKNLKDVDEINGK